MKKDLAIVAWDDPRCLLPLRAAARAWKEKTGRDISVIRRPLTAFNDQPLSQLSPQCDLMIIDYPHIAQALREGAITPIDGMIDARALAAIAAAAVGPAQRSFVIDGRHAALAADTACHVSAFRPARLDALGVAPPARWPEVFALAESAAGAVALALYPTDAISCLMSLTAGAGAGADGGARMFPDADAAVKGVERIAALASVVDPRCWQSTPQDIYRRAAAENAAAYIPLTFGYSHLGRAENGGWRFAPPPAGCGSLLGGAGMAVSARAAHAREAAAFAQWYCGGDGQRLAGRNWGQPAGRAAWEDAVADEMTGGFFSATRATQEAAYIRPLAAWWPAVQKETGETLAAMLRAGEAASAIVGRLEEIYAKHRAPAQ